MPSRPRRKKRGQAPRRLTRFERETEWRRAEMLGHLADRVMPAQKVKNTLWLDAPKSARAVMREKPRRHAPRFR